MRRSGPLMNIFPLRTRVKLGPIIEPETEGETRAKADKPSLFWRPGFVALVRGAVYGLERLMNTVGPD